MKAPRPQRLLAAFLAVLLAALSGGCAPVDRWGVFRKTLEPPVPGEADRRPVEGAEAFRPRLAEEPAFALPSEGPVSLPV